MATRTSTQLTVGETYSRVALREMFDIADATLNTGIFRPAGHDSVWIFITDEKTPDRTQYEDRLEGDDLFFEGQPKGRTDALIQEHRERGLELLVFHRRRKDERPDYSFRYLGPFEYINAQSGTPTKFHVRRVLAGTGASVGLQLVASDAQIRENIRRFARDADRGSEAAKSLVRQTTYWAFDSDDGTFAPSKFAGFQRMTMARYEAALAGSHTGVAFDGHLTRTAIEGILGEFEQNGVLVGLLKNSLEAQFGIGVADHVDQSKWRFAKTSPPRNYWALVCNPARFDGLGAAAAFDTLTWTVNRGDFEVGDCVALWQSKGRGEHRGVIALGEITRGVTNDAGPFPDDAYWVIPDPPGARDVIRFRVIRGNGLPLWESSATRWLGNLAVARAKGGTVFSLQPEEWHAMADAAAVEPDEGQVSPGRRPRRQGFGLTATERRVVERHAQHMAEDHFIGQGYDVQDVSGIDCYDLRCTKGKEELRVEVKGTTGAGESVILTRNEVEHAREQAKRVALVIVSDIRLTRHAGNASAAGGSMRIIRPWAIDDGELAPTQFEYRPGG